MKTLADKRSLARVELCSQSTLIASALPKDYRHREYGGRDDHIEKIHRVNTLGAQPSRQAHLS
jgi:hypothetical protein